MVDGITGKEYDKKTVIAYTLYAVFNGLSTLFWKNIVILQNFF